MSELRHVTPNAGLYPMSYLSTTDDHFNYDQGHLNSDPDWRKPYMLAGTSIENMQPATKSSTVGSNSSCGYLIISLQAEDPSEILGLLDSNSEIAELLAGFMDAVCHESNLKYDHAARDWYVETEEGRQWIELDDILEKFKNTKLMITEMEAALLVISSLARCTVWKDSVLADELNPASVPLPKPSSRAAPDDL